MIDLILITAFGLAAYGGFKLGNKYKTVTDALRAGLDALK